MNRKDVTIVIAAHKAYRMPEDSMYLPLQVGAALTDVKTGYTPDDTGDHISFKNRSYCELTGLYWAWKNLKADFIGLVHYRRHFSLVKKGKDSFENILKYEELKPLLCRYAVFVPKKRNYYIETLYSHYAHTHYAAQLDICKQIINDLYPEYAESFEKVLKHTYGYMFNMMIMRHDLLDEYCEWLFTVLKEMETRYDSSQLDAFQGRFYGRISEIIFNVWLDHTVQSGRLRRDQIRELPFIYMEPVNWWKKGSSFLKAKLIHRKYDRSF